MTPDDFNAAFDKFKVSAFRLECLQTYAVSDENPRLRAFREGLPRPERSVRTSPWLRRIAATTIDGKAWTRVRLVRHPLTEYTRYELIGFAESQTAGEQIRIVDLNRHPELSDLGPDFWLFDAGQPGELAIVMRYEAGSVLGYEYTTDIGWCCDQYDDAMAGSISLAEYVAQRCNEGAEVPPDHWTGVSPRNTGT
ncbi:MAG: hypothetical protein JO115_05245 [Pseudonocardiales bacterium]|nr:hypothetical protein [Pseudonocardiales bacterium]